MLANVVTVRVNTQYSSTYIQNIDYPLYTTLSKLSGTPSLLLNAIRVQTEIEQIVNHQHFSVPHLSLQPRYCYLIDPSSTCGLAYFRLFCTLDEWSSVLPNLR